MAEEVSAETIINHAWNKLLREIPRYYMELTEDQINRVKDVVTRAVKQEFELNDQFQTSVDEEKEPELLTSIMKFIPQERRKTIQQCFEQETYTLQFNDDNSTVSVFHKKQVLFPEFSLRSPDSFLKATIMQIASLFVEAVMFVLSAIGIAVDLSKMQMERIYGIIEPTLHTSAFRRAIDAFKIDWQTGNTWLRAKAFFNLLNATNTVGIVTTVISCLLSDMSFFDYIIAFAEVTAMLIAAFATGGAALIARIFLAVDSAVRIGIKITNLYKLSEIEGHLAK